MSFGLSRKHLWPLVFIVGGFLLGRGRFFATFPRKNLTWRQSHTIHRYTTILMNFGND
jgi:hypothetical protein